MFTKYLMPFLFLLVLSLSTGCQGTSTTEDSSTEGNATEDNSSETAQNWGPADFNGRWVVDVEKSIEAAIANFKMQRPDAPLPEGANEQVKRMYQNFSDAGFEFIVDGNTIECRRFVGAPYVRCDVEMTKTEEGYVGREVKGLTPSDARRLDPNQPHPRVLEYHFTSSDRRMRGYSSRLIEGKKVSCHDEIVWKLAGEAKLEPLDSEPKKDKNGNLPFDVLKLAVADKIASDTRGRYKNPEYVCKDTFDSGVVSLPLKASKYIPQNYSAKFDEVYTYTHVETRPKTPDEEAKEFYVGEVLVMFGDDPTKTAPILFQMEDGLWKIFQ